MAISFNFDAYNRQFHIDRFMASTDRERIDFKIRLLILLKELNSKAELVEMHHRYAYELGMSLKNETAIAISILQKKMSTQRYDDLFHFKDTIRALRKILVMELFEGKNIFYDLRGGVIGYDPNYVPFILGNEMKNLQLKKIEYESQSIYNIFRNSPFILRARRKN